VLCAYQQIRAQNASVLSANGEDNFDRAFNFFRPIIQGNTDTGKKFVGDDLEKTIEFLAQHAFEPSQPEERAALISKYGDPVEKPPVALPGDTEEDSRAKAILKGVATRQLMRTEVIFQIDDFVSDSTCGLRLRLKRGMLGLDKA
jgi:flavine halogenase